MPINLKVRGSTSERHLSSRSLSLHLPAQTWLSSIESDAEKPNERQQVATHRSAEDSLWSLATPAGKFLSLAPVTGRATITKFESTITLILIASSTIEKCAPECTASTGFRQSL